MGGRLCCKPNVRVTGFGIGDDDDDNRRRYISELNTYDEEACRLDPKIQTFNVCLQCQTIRVLSSLAGDAAAFSSLSFNSLREATAVSSNANLVFFVKEVFKNSIEILMFFVAIKYCFRRAHSQVHLMKTGCRSMMLSRWCWEPCFLSPANLVTNPDLDLPSHCSRRSKSYRQNNSDRTPSKFILERKNLSLHRINYPSSPHIPLRRIHINHLG